MLILFNKYVTFYKKNRIDCIHLIYRTKYPNSFFLREGGGRLFEGGCLLQILSLRRGANSKRGPYLKLDANLNIYGILTSDLRDTSAMLYQLSYEATHGRHEFESC